MEEENKNTIEDGKLNIEDGECECGKGKCKDCECCDENIDEKDEKNIETKEFNIDYKDISIRALADLDNYKKRVEEEKIEFRKMASFNVISEFLDIYNNLKQAESFIPEDQKNVGWVKGVVMITNLFKDKFSQFGLEEFNCVGKKFDHNSMDAISTDKDESKEDDVVLKDISSGFRLGDKIVVHAKVVVNKI